MTKPPICSGCQHFWRPMIPTLGVGATCNRPLSTKADLVSGELTERVAANCADERKAGRTFFGFGRERCGPDGRFFVAYQQPAAPLPLHERRGKKLQVVR